MKTTWMILIAGVLLGWGGVARQSLADQVILSNQWNLVQPTPLRLADHLFLDTGAGAERLAGQAATGFALAGANWGIPVTPTNGVALGLQMGGHVRLDGDDAAGDATAGIFGRNFPTYHAQHGALAVLFDYQRTDNRQNLWAVRPIAGTTISTRDALGLEGGTGLNEQNGQRAAPALTTFWTRGWSERIGTEFGAGYVFKPENGTLCRARAAITLTRRVDLWLGGDVNSGANYAVGFGFTYRCGAGRSHASLDNIDGRGGDLDTPFPTKDFAPLYHRTK